MSEKAETEYYPLLANGKVICYALGLSNADVIFHAVNHLNMGGYLLPKDKHLSVGNPVSEITIDRSEQSGMTFMEAVEAMKEGKQVRRLAWKKDRWLKMHGDMTHNTEIWMTVKLPDDQTPTFAEATFAPSSWRPTFWDFTTTDWEIVK